MKLKSLLLGSAAVFVAVSGARAADAIIVEPEPVEYVRVCDAYGAGWFYIPGTETCLKFDGDLRVEYRDTNYHDLDEDLGDHQVRYRARLNVRANNETEYGTLASRIRFTTGTGGGGHAAETTDGFSSGYRGAGTAAVDWAVISLAGFRVGYADDYWTTAGGYGYYNGFRNDGAYGYSQGVFLDYTWAANGWTATVGTEVQYMSFAPADTAMSGVPGQPDVYAGVTYSGGGWYFAGIYYYDSSTAAGAYKVRADYDFGNGFKLGGWYMADDGDTDYVKGHVWAVTAELKLTDNWTLMGGYNEYADQSDLDNSGFQWTAGLRWDIAPGLALFTEYAATNFDNERHTGPADELLFDNSNINVRIVRSF